MSLFKKDDDVVDIPELQKRGILKKVENEQISQVSTQDNDFFDMSSIASATNSSTNPLSFLDSLASTNTAPSTSPPPPITNSSSPTDIMDVNVKLDDFEYKLERFMARLETLEDKIHKSGND